MSYSDDFLFYTDDSISAQWGDPIPSPELIMSDFVPTEYTPQQLQDQQLALIKQGWRSLRVDVKYLSDTRHWRYEFFGVRGALTG